MMRLLLVGCSGLLAAATPTASPTSAPTAAPAEPSCFPGEVAVDSIPLAEYESKLGFLHSLHGEGSFVTIEHEAGELRASGNHLIFNAAGEAVAAELYTAGDELLLTSGLHARVLGLRKDSTEHGMFAPLTASGTVAVEGVQASNYATVGKLNIPHSAMHASFVLSRMIAPLQAQKTASESVNPMAFLFHNVLKLDKLL